MKTCKRLSSSRGKLYGRTSRGLLSSLEHIGRSFVAWWVPALQSKLGQAILEQAGAKGERAKGPSTAQTPVPPQRATLGPCGLALGDGRQQAGAAFAPLCLFSPFPFMICFSLPLSNFSTFALFRSFKLVSPSNVLTVDISYPVRERSCSSVVP